MKNTGYFGRKGIALITVLMITLVLIIMTATMIVSSRFYLNNTAAYRDRIAAQEMARAGLTQCLYLLSQNIYHNTDFDSKAYTSPGYFEVSFNPTNPWHSVNNLANSAIALTPNFRGETVKGRTAELVITANVNSITRRYYVVICQGFNTNRALISMNKINLQGDCTISGIKNLASGMEIPGSIHSNHVTTQADDYAIYWDGTSGSIFNVNNRGMVSCVTGENSSPINSSIHEAVDETQINEKYPEIPIPDIDINSMIDSAATEELPKPPGVTKDGIFTGSGQVNINSICYIGENYKVIGDLNLNGGVLYVKGNLNVTGAIRGVGSIYVSGNTSLKGDNSVVTNQTNGATIFCDGDVTLAGMDTAGYLDYLANHDENVNNALEDYQNLFSEIQTALEAAHSSPTAANATTLYEKLGNLARWDIPVLEFADESLTDWSGYYRFETQPAPDGHIPYCENTKIIPKLLQAIKNSEASKTNPEKTQDLISTLEGLAYILRSSVYHTQMTVESEEVIKWDDDVTNVPIPETNFDRQFKARLWKDFPEYQSFYPYAGEPGAFNYGDFIQNVKTYLDSRPTDMSWIGNSYFQGAIYSRGNLTVSNGFRLLGTVMVHGEVSLNNGAELIFNEEYCNFDIGNAGTFRVLSWEEL